MLVQGRLIIVWLSWLIGGVCGVTLLLVVICYCCPMPRQKSFDEKYLNENHKDVRSAQECNKAKITECARGMRPVSYAGAAPSLSRANSTATQHGYLNRPTNIYEQYASSTTVLDELENSGGVDALKTRSLPAFLRLKPRPLSTEDDLQQLYAKVNYSKKYANRMRNDHAAIIAISKSHSQHIDTDAVIVYDQRTAL